MSLPGTEALRAITEPSKLITLLALDTCPQGQYIDYGSLALRAITLQGENPTREYTKRIIKRHCEVFFDRAGFVAFDADQTSLLLKAEEELLGAAPKHGVAVRELYSRIVEPLPRRIPYETFHALLGQSPTVTVSEHAAVGLGGKRTQSVALRTVTFPARWYHQAACKDKDPDLFFPPAARALSATQAHEAKTVCVQCPVRLACLRAAVDTAQPHGVQGGYWIDQRELTPALRLAVMQRIHINRSRRR